MDALASSPPPPPPRRCVRYLAEGADQQFIPGVDMAVRTARASKITTMKREAAEILKDALALTPEARAALAGSLLESLDTEVDEDAEAVWATEVNRRVAALDSGAVKTIPWAEVRRRLAAR
jgi:putative addiction module component (TIGR02574 family)